MVGPTVCLRCIECRSCPPFVSSTLEFSNANAVATIPGVPRVVVVRNPATLGPDGKLCRSVALGNVLPRSATVRGQLAAADADAATQRASGSRWGWGRIRRSRRAAPPAGGGDSEEAETEFSSFTGDYQMIHDESAGAQGQGAAN